MGLERNRRSEFKALVVQVASRRPTSILYRTATAVLAAVKKAMSAHSTTTVTTTGHSLGKFHRNSSSLADLTPSRRSRDFTS